MSTVIGGVEWEKKNSLTEEHFLSHSTIEDGEVERGELENLLPKHERMGSSFPTDKDEYMKVSKWNYMN